MLHAFAVSWPLRELALERSVSNVDFRVVCLLLITFDCNGILILWYRTKRQTHNPSQIRQNHTAVLLYGTGVLVHMYSALYPSMIGVFTSSLRRLFCCPGEVCGRLYSCPLKIVRSKYSSTYMIIVW